MLTEKHLNMCNTTVFEMYCNGTTMEKIAEEYDITQGSVSARLATVLRTAKSKMTETELNEIEVKNGNPNAIKNYIKHRDLIIGAYLRRKPSSK